MTFGRISAEMTKSKKKHLNSIILRMVNGGDVGGDDSAAGGIYLALRNADLPQVMT